MYFSSHVHITHTFTVIKMKRLGTWLQIQLTAENKKGLSFTTPTSGYNPFCLDTLTDTLGLLPGLTTFNLPATSLVDFRWPQV